MTIQHGFRFWIHEKEFNIRIQYFEDDTVDITSNEMNISVLGSSLNTAIRGFLDELEYSCNEQMKRTDNKEKRILLSELYLTVHDKLNKLKQYEL